jgi:LysM repeat protein
VGAPPEHSVRPRLTALASLGVVFVSVVVIVSTARVPPHQPKHGAPLAQRSVDAAHPPHRYWIVAPGQTIEAISANSGVSIKAIEALNPGLQPEALQIGDRILIRP